MCKELDSAFDAQFGTGATAHCCPGAQLTLVALALAVGHPGRPYATMPSLQSPPADRPVVLHSEPPDVLFSKAATLGIQWAHWDSLTTPS